MCAFNDVSTDSLNDKSVCILFQSFTNTNYSFRRFKFFICMTNCGNFTFGSNNITPFIFCYIHHFLEIFKIKSLQKNLYGPYIGVVGDTNKNKIRFFILYLDFFRFYFHCHHSFYSTKMINILQDKSIEMQKILFYSK